MLVMHCRALYGVPSRLVSACLGCRKILYLRPAVPPRPSSSGLQGNYVSGPISSSRSWLSGLLSNDLVRLTCQSVSNSHRFTIFRFVFLCPGGNVMVSSLGAYARCSQFSEIVANTTQEVHFVDNGVSAWNTIVKLHMYHAGPSCCSTMFVVTWHFISQTFCTL